MGVEITNQEHRVVNNHFEGLIEGLKAKNPSILIRVQIQGGIEPWIHVGRKFIPSIHTSHIVTETYEITSEGHIESRESLELLQLFDTKISMYVWHTAG